MKDEISRAFVTISAGYSADRVIADPELNSTFVNECRRLGLSNTAIELNRILLAIRRQGNLPKLGKRSRRTRFVEEPEYRFAAEMAVRFLERRDGVSLDDVICDPVRAAELDALASSIAPGYSSLQYRWAALNLRKAKHLSPEILARVARPVFVGTHAVPEFNAAAAPAEQGLYIFYTPMQALYVGEAQNLRARLKKHLDHSDNKELARWLWEFGSDQLRLEIQVLQATTTTQVRRALELELIRSRNPQFNVNR